MKSEKTALEEVSPGAQLAALAYQSRRRVGTVLAIAVAGLLGYHLMFGANGVTTYQQKRNESRELQKEIQRLQEENSQLTEHVQHLETDADTIEHEARMILHYARPGEVIYKLNEKASPEAQKDSNADSNQSR
jgi:cell division protein FtsB